MRPTCSAARPCASSRSTGTGRSFTLAFNGVLPRPSNLEKTGPQAPDESIRAYAPLNPKTALTRYMACVTRMDEAIGTVLETLAGLGLEERTLVFFCSDNGGTRTTGNGPLRGIKNMMFEGGLRVPAIARWPGTIPAGSTRNDFLTTLELFPTFLAAAGAEPPSGVVLDGTDMLPVLRGAEPSRREAMFWDHRQDHAVRAGRYKWVESTKGSGLYDLEADLGESHDLSAERPELLADLKTRFANWKKAMDAAEPRGPFRDY